MSLQNDLPLGPMLLTLAIGAISGALVVALNIDTPDLERLRRAKALARSAARGSKAVAEDVEGLMDDWKAHTARFPGDPKGSMSVSVDDLPG